MPLFAIHEGKAKKLEFKSVGSDKDLQQFVEDNCIEILGVHYLASGYSADEYCGDSIDTLGLDENGNPTVILYKKSEHDNVINQALYYLDWLIMNKSHFEKAAVQKLGESFHINWSSPKAILIADNYNKFDKYAVSRLGENINLYKYYWYESNMLYLENIYSSTRTASSGLKLIEGGKGRSNLQQPTMEYHLTKGSEKTVEIFRELRQQILKIDDSINERFTSDYIAYHTTRNFAEVRIAKSCVTVFLLASSKTGDPLNKVEDVPEHYDYPLDKRIRLESSESIEYAAKIIRQSYLSTL